MSLSLIAAIDKNGLIGSNGRLPWHLPADLKHFRELTIGKPVVMGRKTYESIGKPLPSRTNIVISGSKRWTYPHSFSSFRVFRNLLLPSPIEFFVIGGAQLFEAALVCADTIYLTEIDAKFPGDTFFPELEPEWYVTERSRNYTENGLTFRYKTLRWKDSQGENNRYSGPTRNAPRNPRV